MSPHQVGVELHCGMLCETKALERQEGLHSEVVLTAFGLGVGGLAVGSVPGKSWPLSQLLLFKPKAKDASVSWENKPLFLFS